MKIAKPQVHLRKDTANDVYMIHVVTWMDQTKFRENGYNTLPTAASSGVYSIVLKIHEDSGVPNMELLTPIVHTLVLDGIDLDGLDPFIEVSVINTSDSNNEVGKTKTHHDGADDSGMPGPRSKHQPK